MLNTGRAIAGSTARRLKALSLAAMMALPASLFAASDFSKVIPEDALIAAWTNDFSALKDGAKASPYGKMWNDPSMDKVREYVDAEFKKMQEEHGEKELSEINEVTDLLKGGLAVYLKPSAGEFDTKNLCFTGIVEVDEKGKAWLDEKLKDFGKDVKDAKKDSFETNGVTVYRVKGLVADESAKSDETPAPSADGTVATPAPSTTEATMQYAYVDNKYFIYSDSKTEDRVKEAINMVKNPTAEKALAGRDDVKLAEEKSKSAPSQIHVFVNTGTLLSKFIEADPNVDPDVRANIPKTGLYDLKSLQSVVTLTEKSMDVDFAVSTPAEKNGLIKALYAGGPTPLKMVRYVPAGSLDFTSFSLDAGALYDEAMKLVEAFNPQTSAFINMQIAGASAQYEVDIVNNIVKNIAGEHLVVNSQLNDEIKKQLPPAQAALTTSDAYYFGLKNGDQVQTALKTLIANLKKNPDTADSITTSEQDGVTVVIPKVGPEDSPIKIIIAFNKDAIVYTNNEVELQNVIRALNGKVTEPLQETEGYKKLIAGISKDQLYSFTYSPKGSISAALHQLREMADEGFFSSVDGFTPEMVPTAEVAAKYFGDSYSTIVFDEKMLSVKTRIQAPTK